MSRTFRSDVQRFLIGYPVDHDQNPSTREDDDAQAVLGFRVAKLLAKDHRNTVWLITNDKRELELGSDLRGLLGDGAAKSLARDGYVSVGDGIQLRHTTPRSKTGSPSGVVLYFRPTQETLESQYLNFNVGAEVVVPGHLSDVQPWIDTWGPRQLFAKGDPVQLDPLEITDPDVRDAVDQSLSLSGVSHASDVERARKLFAALRRRKKELDLAAIRAHALRTTGHGVPAADRLINIAKGRTKAR